jgi:UDP-N-acetyl-2-amino-2-deoxyglucuronate dehydrogenase
VVRTFPDPLRVGLIGCGDIAPAHARALAETSRARLAACMDVVEASARSLGEEFHVPFTTELAELLARDDVDLITIATPAFTHLELTQAAVQAGKAVLCEKPLAANLDDADDMIGACEQARLPLSTCFPLRYLGAARWARELLEAGALGRLICVRMRSLSEKQESYWAGGYSGRTATEWRKSKTASGGGVFITNLSHHIDLARAITGLEAARAYAEVGTFATGVEVEDLGVATLRYENDAIALVEGSSIFWGGNREWDMVLLGTKGQVRFAFWGGKAEAYLTEAGAGLPAREWTARQFEDQTHIAFYDDLAAELQAGREPPVTGEDGRAALETVLGIYRAAGTGEPVLFPLEG